MTDPGTEPAVKDEDVENFQWWLCMLPFIVGVGLFVYKWWQNKADTGFLVWAGGCLLIGLVFSAMIAAGSAGGTASGAGGDNNDQSKGG